MAELDILDDINQKFLHTIVMYDKKAVVVKSCEPSKMIPHKFSLTVANYNARAYKTIELADPALNYQTFNIGYVNGGYPSWWYRKPQKQWSQGLKGNQMGYRLSTPGMGPHDNFGFSKSFTNMLENVYPNIEDVKKSLIEHNFKAMAFHKDFALSYDDIHDDFILEYHGNKIGVSLNNDLKQFKVMPEAKHLIEALQEVRSAQS